MKKIKKRWIVLLLCFLLTAVPTACGEDRTVPEEEAEKDVLIYAALDPVTGTLEKSIARFNEKHEDVQIEIHDYSDEGGRERLQIELMLGQVPDIMELRCYGGDADEIVKSGKYGMAKLPGSFSGPKDGYFMPYRQLAQRGYLEDLWPYIENDPDLGRESVLEAPLKAAEVNGGLYMLFERVEIFTLIGRASVVGGRYSWTLDDMMEAYAAMPEGSVIMRHNMTKWEVFYNLLSSSLEGFVNRETGECTFDSKGFRDLVGFLEACPDEVDYEKPREAEDEVKRQIRNGTQMLEGLTIVWPYDVLTADGIFQERAAFVGYPTADGSSGSFFYQTGTVLGMSSACRNKEAAWAYIRQMITPRLRKSNAYIVGNKRSTNTPVSLPDYEVICWYNLSYLMDEIYSKQMEYTGYWTSTRQHFQYGPEIRFTELMKEEDLQRHRELLDHTTRLYWPEDDLADIVWETLGAYFAGDRTLDDTIRLLENRVSLYLHEQQ